MALSAVTTGKRRDGLEPEPASEVEDRGGHWQKRRELRATGTGRARPSGPGPGSVGLGRSPGESLSLRVPTPGLSGPVRTYGRAPRPTAIRIMMKLETRAARNPRARSPSPSESPSPVCPPAGMGMGVPSPICRGSGVHPVIPTPFHWHPRFAGDRGSSPSPAGPSPICQNRPGGIKFKLPVSTIEYCNGVLDWQIAHQAHSA